LLGRPSGTLVGARRSSVELFARRERASLDDVVEYLRGIATILMDVKARSDPAARRRNEDEEADS
jgi:hypothetical protein